MGLICERRSHLLAQLNSRTRMEIAVLDRDQSAKCREPYGSWLLNCSRDSFGPPTAKEMRVRSKAKASQSKLRKLLILAIFFGLFLQHSRAAEGPFFIAYTHRMEEPGNLEISLKTVTGSQTPGKYFLGAANELEYGVKGWWTTELYLDGQSTRGESTIFTGYRWENRFRVLPGEHWINPVLYIEFENISGADKSLLEVVGHDGKANLAAPNDEARQEKKREIEAKLILGSYFKGWTLAENFIAEKNVRHEPYEFGYAVGISRPLALAARPDRCDFCRENFELGVEVYGGLGTPTNFGLFQTSHYVAPTTTWALANGTAFKISPSFGVTATSARFLLRFDVTYEIQQFGRTIRKMFGVDEARR